MNRFFGHYFLGCLDGREYLLSRRDERFEYAIGNRRTSDTPTATHGRYESRVIERFNSVRDESGYY
jgi:hypothetical protein